jgi:hypothetical protein
MRSPSQAMRPIESPPAMPAAQLRGDAQLGQLRGTEGVLAGAPTQVDAGGILGAGIAQYTGMPGILCSGRPASIRIAHGPGV